VERQWQTTAAGAALQAARDAFLQAVTLDDRFKNKLHNHSSFVRLP
jgi:hypothetical protein